MSSETEALAKGLGRLMRSTFPSVGSASSLVSSPLSDWSPPAAAPLSPAVAPGVSEWFFLGDFASRRDIDCKSAVCCASALASFSALYPAWT